MRAVTVVAVGAGVAVGGFFLMRFIARRLGYDFHPFAPKLRAS